MEGLEPGKRLTELLEKYKYALLILVIGLCLMLIPGKTEKAETPQPAPQTVQQETMEEHLTRILAQVDGAGKVTVLLSEQEGSEVLYQTDTQTDDDESRSSEQRQTVIVTDTERNESGLVRRTDPPKYLGAVVVCQGADRPDVRLAIVEAVRCATGLGANQISVVKMK